MDDVLTVYRQMTTTQLELLQRAFRLDIERAERLSTITFCDQRLAWIDQVLTERLTPPRFAVVPDDNQHGGAGWALFDRQRQRITGGWFADRNAAEATATVLNRTGD